MDRFRSLGEKRNSFVLYLTVVNETCVMGCDGITYL